MVEVKVGVLVKVTVWPSAAVFVGVAVTVLVAVLPNALTVVEVAVMTGVAVLTTVVVKVLVKSRVTGDTIIFLEQPAPIAMANKMENTAMGYKLF